MSNEAQQRRAEDDETVAQPFDQTNGMMPDEYGDSDGTAASDTSSAAERPDDEDMGGPTTDEEGSPTQGQRGLAGGAAGMAMHRGG